MRWILVPLLALGACSRQGPAATQRESASPSGRAPAPSAEPTPSSTPNEPESACVLPISPRELVLQVNRHVVPIGRAITQEVAEVTAEGPCTPKVECARVTPAKMNDLLAQVRVASGVRHRRAYVSPHYGYRSIVARFRGGACEIADGVLAPLVEEDNPKFFAAFDAIVDAVIAERDGSSPVLAPSRP